MFILLITFLNHLALNYLFRVGFIFRSFGQKCGRIRSRWFFFFFFCRLHALVHVASFSLKCFFMFSSNGKEWIYHSLCYRPLPLFLNFFSNKLIMLNQLLFLFLFFIPGLRSQSSTRLSMYILHLSSMIRKCFCFNTSNYQPMPIDTDFDPVSTWK